MLFDRPPQHQEEAAAQSLIKAVKTASARLDQEWVPTAEVLATLRRMGHRQYAYSNEYDRKTKQHRLNLRLKNAAIMDLIDGRWDTSTLKGGIGRYEWRVKPKAGQEEE